MKKDQLDNRAIDYVEMYVPMAKPLVYWHVTALGFSVVAYSGPETGHPGICSYVLRSGKICLVLTSSYPVNNASPSGEVTSFTASNHCGVKRIAFHVSSVQDMFYSSMENGAIPIKFPATKEDDYGYIEEASIKLYEHNEIVFVNRDNYRGVFKPGYKEQVFGTNGHEPFFTSIDHIASELRINETDYWTNYLAGAIGSQLVQKIGRSEDNKTGMILNISQTFDKEIIFVMTEPENRHPNSRVQQSLEKFGPGIHHVAFSTDDIVETIKELRCRNVDFVAFPHAYYELLRTNKDFEGTDIDSLEAQGILIDKEDDTYLLQKFVKPMGDRPYFFYEIVQRMNGYNGFALKNIAALRKAEEIQITQVANA